MLKKIIHFIQYHNFFTIAVMFVFVGASVSFAASPDLRQGVYAQTEMVRSVDNTFVVNTDFDTYDMGVRVLSVTEDADGYYVDYTYNVVEARDYVWQPVSTNGSMKVSKKELAGRDLGLYVAGQLGQVIDQQISYLKEVQKKEKKNGATQKVVATEYSGLIGQFLRTDEKTFDGYTPVVTAPESAPPEQEQVAGAAESQQSDSGNTIVPSAVPPPASVTSQSSLTRTEVEQLIRDRVAQLLAGSTGSTTLTTGSSPQASGNAPATTISTTTSTTNESVKPVESQTDPAPASSDNTNPPAVIIVEEVATQTNAINTSTNQSTTTTNDTDVDPTADAVVAPTI
jgi:hypothetical protein